MTCDVNGSGGHTAVSSATSTIVGAASLLWLAAMSTAIPDTEVTRESCPPHFISGTLLVMGVVVEQEGKTLGALASKHAQRFRHLP